MSAPLRSGRITRRRTGTSRTAVCCWATSRLAGRNTSGAGNWTSGSTRSVISRNRCGWAQSPVAGKTVLLHSELGLGDTLLFCRYASEGRRTGREGRARSAAAVAASARRPRRRRRDTPQGRSVARIRLPLPADEPAARVQDRPARRSSPHSVRAQRSRTCRRLAGDSGREAQAPRGTGVERKHGTQERPAQHGAGADAAAGARLGRMGEPAEGGARRRDGAAGLARGPSPLRRRVAATSPTRRRWSS